MERRNLPSPHRDGGAGVERSLHLGITGTVAPASTVPVETVTNTDPHSTPV
jgi:hypothetical protein